MKSKLLVVVVALTAFGCGGLGTEDPLIPADAGVTDAGTNTASQLDTDGGMPCDVLQVLKENCQSCHGEPLKNNATVRLLTRADLMAQSSLYPDQRVADRVIVRMGSSGGQQMPPVPTSAVSLSDQFKVLNWVNAGMPAGACDPNAPITPVCTSGKTWIYGNAGSSFMNPGMACMSCHSQYYDAPRFGASGTVYPTAHEPDKCDGTDGTVTTTRVEIIDANGGVHPATVNAAGNFYTYDTLVFPITARVLKNGQVRAMTTPQTTGDCNSCHTVQGANGAPGRIYEP